MGHSARILAAVAIIAAGTLPLAAFDGPTQSTAPKTKAGTERSVPAMCRASLYAGTITAI